jgi:hypothetical protein
VSQGQASLRSASGLAALALLCACSNSSGSRPATLRESLTPIAFDSARGVTVLFDGETGETREWDGSAWNLRATSGPAPREGHALAYDSGRGVTVLFGGFGGAGLYLGDTWEWDGTSWSERTPPFAPLPRYSHALAYDSARGVTVLFGGQSNAISGETWEWDGTRWTQKAGGPSPRSRLAMAFDSRRGLCVLHGGYDAGFRDDDTWEYDGFSWANLDSGARPSPRYLHAMAYDGARGVTVLFGGYDDRPGETWEFDGLRRSWTQIPVRGPTPRNGHSMAYDSRRGVTVLFGGFDGSYARETWEWDGFVWVRRDGIGLSPRPALVARPAAGVERVLFSQPTGRAGLYSFTPGSRRPVALHRGHPSMLHFELTPDQEHAIYLADPEHPGQLERYLVPVDGSAPARRLGAPGF